jgi:hypothetical protein
VLESGCCAAGAKHLTMNPVLGAELGELKRSFKSGASKS